MTMDLYRSMAVTCGQSNRPPKTQLTLTRDAARKDLISVSNIGTTKHCVIAVNPTFSL